MSLHSLSKSYNMTGWRIGFVAGNPLIVKAFSDVKDNNDSGQFIAIQKLLRSASLILRLPKRLPPNTPAATTCWWMR